MHMCCALFTTPRINVQPDLSAPGIDILAAWTPLSPVSGNLKDSRFAAYSIISGTSMACPHATGVAAYVKTSSPSTPTGHRR
jgi:subtilisin family serine protease